MVTQAKRTTVYLKHDLYEALRLKAIETSTSVSKLINNAVREAITEDIEDLKIFEERKKESLITFNEMLKRLKRKGRI